MIYHRWAAQIGAFYRRLFALVHRVLDGRRTRRPPTYINQILDASFEPWVPTTTPEEQMNALALLGHGMLGNNAWTNAYAQVQMDQQSKYQNALAQGIRGFAQ